MKITRENVLNINVILLFVKSTKVNGHKNLIKNNNN